MSELRTKLSTAATPLVNIPLRAACMHWLKLPALTSIHFGRLQICCFGSPFLLKLEHPTGCAIFRCVRAIRLRDNKAKGRFFGLLFRWQSTTVPRMYTFLSFHVMMQLSVTNRHNSDVYILDLLMIWLIVDWTIAVLRLYIFPSIRISAWGILAQLNNVIYGDILAEFETSYRLGSLQRLSLKHCI